MLIDLHQLILLGMLSAALHWLFARSAIMRPLWSRARGRVAELLACPACSGWWLGVALWLAHVRPVAVTWMRFETTRAVEEVCATSLLALVLTPVVEAIVLWGLERSAIEPGDTGTDEE